MHKGTGMTIEQRVEIVRAPDEVRLTTKQTAAAAGVAPATLRKWACNQTSGRLLPITKRAGRNLYRPSDVRRWLGLEES